MDQLATEHSCSHCRHYEDKWMAEFVNGPLKGEQGYEVAKGIREIFVPLPTEFRSLSIYEEEPVPNPTDMPVGVYELVSYRFIDNEIHMGVYEFRGVRLR